MRKSGVGWLREGGGGAGYRRPPHPSATRPLLPSCVDAVPPGPAARHPAVRLQMPGPALSLRRRALHHRMGEGGWRGGGVQLVSSPGAGSQSAASFPQPQEPVDREGVQPMGANACKRPTAPRYPFPHPPPFPPRGWGSRWPATWEAVLQAFPRPQNPFPSSTSI